MVKDKYFLKIETKGKDKNSVALMQGKSLDFFGELWKGSRNKDC
jgi:hypothetical protein